MFNFEPCFALNTIISKKVYNEYKVIKRYIINDIKYRLIIFEIKSPPYDIFNITIFFLICLYILINL